jgi:hypothetical protein
MITDEIVNSMVPQERGISDLGENATFEQINLSCIWEPRDNDQSEYGVSAVIGCEFISTDVNDPLITKSVDNDKVNITGEYGISTFDRISYEFKDIETNETFHVKGWPPTDPRIKYMYKLNQDPREIRDVNYIVDFLIEFDFSSLLVAPPSTEVPPPPPPTPSELGIITDSVGSNYNFYVDESTEKAYRKDRVIFNQTVRNYSFRKLAPELKKILDSME